jgi:hypothetical protein
LNAFNTRTYIAFAVIAGCDNFNHKKVPSLRVKKPNIESSKFEEEKAK